MTLPRGPVVDWAQIDHVVLDMDGTLLDLHFDNQVWYELLPRRYGAHHGLPVEVARERILGILAPSRGTLPWYSLGHWRSRLGIDIAELEHEVAHLVGLRPGVAEFLERLARLPVRRIIATNAEPPSLARKLALTGLDQRVDEVISAHELGAAKEEESFWPALAARIGHRPERVVFIDDNHAVLRAARRHGIRHAYGVARPDTRGARIESAEFTCLEDLAEVFGAAP